MPNLIRGRIVLPTFLREPEQPVNLRDDPSMRTPILLAATLLAVLAALLALVSSSAISLTSWLSFFIVSILAAVLVWAARNLLGREDPPRWLAVLVLGAIALRLALGVFWFTALPAWGYGGPVEEAGYVMEDAYVRDRAAWELAQSDQPLLDAFRGFSASDQYGGLLFLSAALYRYFGAGSHQPLLMVLFTAAVSSLAVAFAWAFANRLWGERVSKSAAWGLALYPEAALLGSSQMREAFSVTLTIWALYALLRLQRERTRQNAFILLFPILFAIPLSFPFAVFLVGALSLAALALHDWSFSRRRAVWLFTGLFGALLVFVATFFVDWSGVWLVQFGEWQAYVAQNASGWVARQFERVPAWAQFPFLIVYGVFRPLLPAALVANGAPIWQGIAIWRSLGWTILLVLLLYATYHTLRERPWLKLPGALLVSNWALIFFASYRGGGDDWDNPRYRSAFAAVQLVLAAWALTQQREEEDPWLKRAVVGSGLMMAWFVPWYLRRYAVFEWPIVELHQVIGLGLVSAALYAIWDWVGGQ